MKQTSKILIIITICLFSYSSSFSQSRKAQELADNTIVALFKKAPGYSTEKKITVTITDIEIEDGRYYMDVKVEWYGGAILSNWWDMNGTIAVDANGCNCIWNIKGSANDMITSGKRQRQELGCVN